jgi:hypothetical protein
LDKLRAVDGILLMKRNATRLPQPFLGEYHKKDLLESADNLQLHGKSVGIP